jgi:hypothetical protein
MAEMAEESGRPMNDERSDLPLCIGVQPRGGVPKRGSMSHHRNPWSQMKTQRITYL